jgi:hypothetical protein
MENNPSYKVDMWNGFPDIDTVRFFLELIIG